MKPLPLVPQQQQQQSAHKMILRQRTKTCDSCAQTFFFSIDGRTGLEVPCAEGSAYFCTPFCQRAWLKDQFRSIEQQVYGDDGSMLYQV